MPDRDAAIAAVEQHCETTATAAEPFNDGVNTVFGVTTTAGERYVVKFGTCDPTAVAAEPFIIRVAASFGAPVPSVQGVGRYDGTPYFVATWLNGSQPAYPMELSSEELRTYAVDVGRVLAQLQSGSVPVGELQGSAEGLVGSHDDWTVFYREHLTSFAEDAKKNYGSLGSDAMRLAHWATIPEVETAYLCPLDLHTHNLLYESGELIGIIDFERYYGGHPAWGVAVTRRSLTTNRPTDVASRAATAFNKGYEAVSSRPTTHPVFELGALLREMRAAHMWWDDPSDHRSRFSDELQAIEEEIAEN